MKTVHKFTLKEAEDILRKEHNIKADDGVEIERTPAINPAWYFGCSGTSNIPLVPTANNHNVKYYSNGWLNPATISEHTVIPG